MVGDLAGITNRIIMANLNANFIEGLDMKLRGVTTGLIQVLLVQPHLLRMMVLLMLILAKSLIFLSFVYNT